MKKRFGNERCFVCGARGTNFIASIKKRPQKETDFKILPKDYYREIYFCNNCNTYNSFHDYDFSALYSEKYTRATYKNKVLEAFKRIIDFPEDISDNKYRVERVKKFCRKKGIDLHSSRVLDVGSGLCVFFSRA